jgi:hypothetical protein
MIYEIEKKIEKAAKVGIGMDEDRRSSPVIL